MFINKTAMSLHVVRFRSRPLVYMTTTNDMEASIANIGTRLRRNEFANKEFQHAYEQVKMEMGLLDPDPSEILIHQFVSTADLNGYGSGHWLLRDYIARDTGLHNVTNIGDWLSVEGYIDITPSDQDKRKFLHVTDIGKYYASNGCFDSNVYPLYILASENNQVLTSGLVENHRDLQPVRGGYDRASIYIEGQFKYVGYNDTTNELEPERQRMVVERPMRADGLLYTSIDQFARSRNLPPWLVLDMVETQGSVMDTNVNWQFV